MVKKSNIIKTDNVKATVWLGNIIWINILHVKHYITVECYYYYMNIPSFETTFYVFLYASEFSRNRLTNLWQIKKKTETKFEITTMNSIKSIYVGPFNRDRGDGIKKKD